MLKLQIKQGVKTYQDGMEKVNALNGVDLEITQGEIIVILGTSGSGKSTLLQILGGLDTLSSGSIMLDDHDYCKKSDRELSKLRRQKFGFVFQSFQLLPNLRIYDNIVLPITLDKHKIDKHYIHSLIQDLGLESFLNRRPSQLSGGQQQRVAIARALANQPEIIFADEPTGNLDSKTGREVMKLFIREVKAKKHTLVMVTHDQELAKEASRVIHIEEGIITSDESMIA